MRRKDVFQSNYLKQDDVVRPTVLVIRQVALETVGTGTEAEQKAVIHWTSEQKPMVCNNHNWTVCEDAYGEDSDFWTGKRVEVYVDPNVSFGGKRTGGLRLRIPGTNHVAPPQEFWTLEKCTAECADAGIDRPTMVSHLKANGQPTFNTGPCTPIIQALIASRTQGDAYENAPLGSPPPQDDIPF